MSLPDDVDAVALTFDDGFTSFARLALPLLQAHALPATVFVVSEHVGGTNAWQGRTHPGIPVLPLMDWQTLEQVVASGVVVGAHTRSHPDLTALPAAVVAVELGESAATIERAVGVRPTTFAYPYGRYTHDVIAAVGQWFTHACTTELRPLTGADDPLALPRLDAWYFQRPGQLEAWGSAPFRRRLWLRARGREVRRLVLERRVAG